MIDTMSFNDQALRQKQRWAQIGGGGLRSNAPAGAKPSQGGAPSPTTTPSPSGATATMLTPMNPQIPGVPQIFPSGAAAAPAVVTGQYAGTPQGRYDTSGDGKPSRLDRTVGSYQHYAEEGVKGYGDLALQDLRKQIGETLGGLNGIGALRSGQVVTSMNDLVGNYGRQIGDYAKMTSLEATRMGQDENAAEIERKRRDEADRRSRRGGFLRGVGTLLGAGVGLVTGGPAGAIAGAQGARAIMG